MSASAAGEPVICVKIGVFGWKKVGKTSLIHVFCVHRSCDGDEEIMEDLPLQRRVIDGKQFELNLVDCCSDEENPNQVMKTVDAFVLVYDTTNRESFDRIDEVLQQIYETREGAPSPFVLCGNKCDLSSDRVVSNEEGVTLAGVMHVPFFETSAKTCTNVDEVFTELVRQYSVFKESKQNDNSEHIGGRRTICTIC